MRGFWGVGVYRPKNSTNLGTLWRSAHNFGANFLFTVESRTSPIQASDTTCAWKHIPLYVYPSIEELVLPLECPMVGVEQVEGAQSIPGPYPHLERVAYLLGAEDCGLPARILEFCRGGALQILTPRCLNVAVAGSIVMYDRASKKNKGVIYEG